MITRPPASRPAGSLSIQNKIFSTRPHRATTCSEALPLSKQAAAFYRRQLRTHPAAIDYLKRRGVTGEIARDFGLGYAPAGWDALLGELGTRFPQATLQAAGLLSRNDSGKVYDKFRDRIMFPIRDTRGRTIAFGGRVLEQGEPKYLNSPETAIFHKSNTLYGLYELRRQRERFASVIVVEGYMDVIALAQYDIRNAVATLGTATTAEHLRALFRLVDKIVFCFDGDRAGREAAWRALNQSLAVLRDGLEVAFLFLPEGEDPDTFLRTQGREAFQQRLERAQPLSEYLLATLKARYPAPTLEQRTKIALEAGKLLKDMAPGLLRSELERSVAALSGIAAPDRGAQQGFPRPPKPRHIRVTPERMALAAVLHEPTLATEVPAIEPEHYAGLPEVALLMLVVDLARELDRPTTAAVVEHLRGTEHAALVDHFAVWEPPGIEVGGWQRHLRDALGQVQRRVMERRLDELLERSREGPLTAAQTQELDRLLKERRL